MHQCTKTTPFAKSKYPLEPIHKITRTQQKKLMAVLINKKQETTQRRIKAPNQPYTEVETPMIPLPMTENII